MEHAHRILAALTVIAAGCGAQPTAAPGQPATAIAPTQQPTAALTDVATEALPAPASPGCIAGSRDAVAQKLSESGCFDAVTLEPVAGLIPFSPNAPMWTDGAEKTRYMSIPAGTQIGTDGRGDFVFPVGSVLIKTFTLEGRKLETRLLMHHADGWQGYPYQWNADGSDAVLVLGGARLEGVQADGSGWSIPSSGSCSGCHNQETHVAMGPEIAQLNGPLDHPASDYTGNQLQLLQDLGVLAPLGFPLESLPALVDPNDETQPLDERARAYLHANCSSCHTAPENFCSGDLRWSADMVQTGVCNVPPKQPLAEWAPETMLLSPGAPDRSAILLRLSAEAGSAGAMPPVGREHVDTAGAALIRQWIASLDGCQ